jgi:hypothetical protein
LLAAAKLNMTMPQEYFVSCFARMRLSLPGRTELMARIMREEKAGSADRYAYRCYSRYDVEVKALAPR